MKSIDLRSRQVIAARDVEDAMKAGATELRLRKGCILTPAARDLLRTAGLTLHAEDGAAAGHGRAAGDRVAAARGPAGPTTTTESERLFHSAEAEAVKAEIVAVGRKLWQRQYVDGNGGNISYRLADNAVLCTPTLVSKADLTPDDLSLVDLEGRQLLGDKPRTSEALLHLEIYKAVPEAKAVLHCHPPHATAYAITGRVPPTCVIPEFEVFVGKVALAPYETPGTPRFAETVLPFVKTHNTILLANHGIVCWADTVTHAEWYAEVLDTYCQTLMLAAQLGAPLTRIPEGKAADLLAIKRRLGLPDARHDVKECDLCERSEPCAIALPARPCGGSACASANGDTEAIVQAVTDAVLRALENPGSSS
jgi:L-fuculose-phosphate aldolase